MSVFNVGRICIKTVGRDAGMKCIVLSEPSKNEKKGLAVLVDGVKVRRKNCNVLHLEPLSETVKVKANAPHEDVVKVLN
ncbi:MAG: 50S ribosomal protein L14e [Candidatus Diapherotrites archaeon]|nr:50S ribosomal protein L14e [Candidatus Diapherotrites archaeon]